MVYPDRRVDVPSEALPAYLRAAAAVIADAASGVEALERPATTADFEHLRWFPYPDEAVPS
jgi:hypothetical protein